MRGRLLHENVDRAHYETREGVRVEYAMPLWSDRLGLIGKGDAVEFHGAVPYPVEHKQGRRRASAAVACSSATRRCAWRK